MKILILLILLAPAVQAQWIEINNDLQDRMALEVHLTDQGWTSGNILNTPIPSGQTGNVYPVPGSYQVEVLVGPTGEPARTVYHFSNVLVEEFVPGPTLKLSEAALISEYSGPAVLPPATQERKEERNNESCTTGTRSGTSLTFLILLTAIVLCARQVHMTRAVQLQ